MRRMIIAAVFAGVLGGRAISAQAPLTAQDVSEIETVVAAHVGQRLEGRAPVFDPQVRNGERAAARARAMASALRASMGQKEKLLHCAAGKCTLGAEVLVRIDLPAAVPEGAEVKVEVLERVDNDPLRVGVHFAERDLLVVRKGGRWVVSRVVRMRVT